VVLIQGNRLGGIMIKFGVAGNPEDFYNRGLKASEQMPAYLDEFGLEAYEYQCSRGVRVSDKKAQLLKEQSEKYGIALSVHAPYFISLSTEEEEKRRKSIQYITDTATAAKKMGADRVIVHTGSVLKLERSKAMENVHETMKLALHELDKLELSDIAICPETMGKINQLGNSEEVISLCKLDARMLPTIDFGHLYCRNLGSIRTRQHWKEELEKYLDALGYDRMKHFHSDFSKMEYTEKGGEKRHVTFADQEYGPEFEEVAGALIDLNLEPRIICESAGTQSQDARAMKQMYLDLSKL